MAVDAVFLVTAIAALFAGPLARGMARRGGAIDALIDAFLPIAVVASVVTGVLPETLAVIGPWALLAAIVGFAMPVILERAASGATRRGRAALALVLLALVPHFLIDGFALMTHDHAHAADASERWPGMALALSVILHQLPFGLFLWNFALNTNGRRAAWFSITLSAVLITTGFVVAERVHMFAEGSGAAVMESFVAGTIAHVVLYHGSFALHEVRPDHPRWRLLGVAAALALVTGAPAHSHGHGELTIPPFSSVALWSLPAALPALVYGVFPVGGRVSGRLYQSISYALAAFVVAPAVGPTAAVAVAAAVAAGAWVVIGACETNRGGHAAMGVIVGLGAGYLALAAASAPVGIALIFAAAILAPSPIAPAIAACVAFNGSELLPLAVAVAAFAMFVAPTTIALTRGESPQHRVSLATMVGMTTSLVVGAIAHRLGGPFVDLPVPFALVASALVLIAAAWALARFGWPAVLPAALHGDHGEFETRDACGLPPVDVAATPTGG